MPADRLVDALRLIESWAADHAAAAVVLPRGVVATVGDADRPFRWASVTKLVTALAVLRAIDGGLVGLDEPAGPPGATVRHLLGHASGLPFEGRDPIAAPATTRIYSNAGFDRLGELLAERRGRSSGHELARAVLDPLGMTSTRLDGRPSDGLVGPLRDLGALAAELLRPTLVRSATFAAATSVAFPGLRGILPGFGRYDPLDWGLGFELRDGKEPHWTGARTTASTFGHFGGTGTFLWVDPMADVALAVLTDRPFGPWAVEAWPALSDAVLEALA
ncbi:MAG TPA: serine hydrolase domain-containing protein [Candidatus Limnocylindrales bacterium]|nr:serine hydrolase domain-containing protein [Candidatus Limnocylindrales bacterium]